LEGRNPDLIKEIFAPGRVLDYGCGPGVLMFLLLERGIVADGFDVSREATRIAPPEVRERILTGDPSAIPDDSYDLVICREVLEHLTVLDAVRAIREMCRISSRFVYVTTRFHPDPRDLLDIADERSVDPTHITLMDKDLVRLLFVLEGFRRRGDLEARMDWLHKGRVLVYEKWRGPRGG
jgi:SAM-dependent methyltransferase